MSFKPNMSQKLYGTLHDRLNFNNVYNVPIKIDVMVWVILDQQLNHLYSSIHRETIPK